jgi:hypothetical protein
MFSFSHKGLLGKGLRCSRGTLALLCLLLLTQSVPRLGRAIRSLALNGHVNWGPVRRALPEVPNTSPASVAHVCVSRRCSPGRAPGEPLDRRATLDRSRDADRSLPLNQFASCRALPRSHPSDADDVIVRNA